VGGRPPPDSRFVTYRAPVHQVANIYILSIICKIVQIFFIVNSLLGDELAIAQQLISDILTCFSADVLNRVPLAAEASHRGALQDSYINMSYRKNKMSNNFEILHFSVPI